MWLLTVVAYQMAARHQYFINSYSFTCCQNSHSIVCGRLVGTRLVIKACRFSPNTLCMKCWSAASNKTMARPSQCLIKHEIDGKCYLLVAAQLFTQHNQMKVCAIDIAIEYFHCYLSWWCIAAIRRIIYLGNCKFTDLCCIFDCLILWLLHCIIQVIQVNNTGKIQVNNTGKYR